VIYTSGSTGQPKGVAVTHQAVNRLVMNTDYAPLTSTDVVAQASNVSFDAATFEIWGALLNGARLVMTTKDTLLSPRSLATAIERHGITTLFLTTALFNQMVEKIPAALAKLRYLLFGGEAVDPQRVKELLQSGSPKHLLHVYGPTETTTFASWYWVREVAEDAITVPIGRPIANTEIYILDAHLNPVPIGVTAELYIGGPGVARGYLNRPELTAAKFVADPFSNEPQARLYRTGDLARYLSDGNIEFVGRTDDQVKIRGFRIEPGEIETMLNQHSGIRECVVIARQDDGREISLAAYVVAAMDSRLTSQDLRAFLKERVPEYMIPAAFVYLNSLPLTLNGKVDRRALPAPDWQRPEDHIGYVAPRTEVEAVLAEIWAEILKVERVGIHDNFFELGGHSLMGSRLVARVCKELQVDVPLRRLFECPTVAALADRLSGDLSRAAADRRANSSWRYLIELKPGAGSQTVFLLPGGVGGDYEFLVYARLTHFVGENYRFYGLRARSADGTERAHPNVEEMAADYLHEIRALQPDGPYFLVGNCIGGIVAYEIARQLEATGEKAALLVLMDTSLPSLRNYLRYRAIRLTQRVQNFYLRLRRYHFRTRTRHHFARIRELTWNKRVGYFISETREAFPKTRNLVAILVPIHVEAGSDHVRVGYIDALQRHRPRPYQGEVVMLNSETTGSADPTLGWKNLVGGGIDVHKIPGDHEAYIRQYVRIAGEKLRHCLDQAVSAHSRVNNLTENIQIVGNEPKSVTGLGA
jgi:thioesterase domain-containing protein/acyl carrier protein